MKLKALIFDVDGTLADTEEMHRTAFNQAFQAHGLDWNWSKPRYAHLLAIGGGKERLRTYITSLGLDAATHAGWIAKIPEIHATKTRLYTALVREGGVPLREGVARLLKECQSAGVKLAIASTTTAENIDALLGGNRLQQGTGQFSVIGAGDCVARKKPAPDIYQWVLERLHEPAANCAAIEDSANGMHAAKAAGLYTIVTPSYWTRGEDFSAADLLLPSLGSAARPLKHNAAALIGSTMLGVETIDRQLRRMTEANHGHS